MMVRLTIPSPCRASQPNDQFDFSMPTDPLFTVSVLQQAENIRSTPYGVEGLHYRSGLCSTRETICFHDWASDSIKRGPYIIDNDILRIQLKINKGKRKKKNRGNLGSGVFPSIGA